MMNYLNLKDMKLSQIVLGTDGYGERIDKKTAFDLMKIYLANGGNVLDTARLYCGGESERIIGEFVKGMRDRVYISTKCAHPPSGRMDISRLSEAEIESDIDESLRTLSTDYIDILWLHRDDVTKNVEPIIDSLNKMVKKGKIRYFGASNWTHDRIFEANGYAEKSGQDGFVASQALYNLAKCSCSWDDTLVGLENEEKSKYDKNPFPVFAFSSQAKGFFEKYHNNSLSEKARERYFNEETLKTYEKVKSLAEQTGDTLSYTALSLLIEQSNFDVFPIIGPSSVEQLKQSLNVSEEV